VRLNARSTQSIGTGSGGRVLVSFGEPVAVSMYLAVCREEPAKALHTLTMEEASRPSCRRAFERCSGPRSPVVLLTGSPVRLRVASTSTAA
jgi:hypothetical protein